MNIANFFTATRMVAAPLFICIYYLPRYVGISEQTVMLILIPLFIYMEFTDFLDGYYARKLKQVSDFGIVGVYAVRLCAAACFYHYFISRIKYFIFTDACTREWYYHRCEKRWQD